MPTWVWYFIVPCAIVLLAVIILALLTGKLKLRARVGSEEIEITAHDRTHVIAPGEVTKHDPSAARRFAILSEQLPLIRQVKWSAWLSAVKRAAIAAVDIVALDDTQFYMQALGNIIWSGNGIRSYKTLLEAAIMGKEWQTADSDAEFDLFIDNLMRRIIENENKYLDSNYQTIVLEVDGDTHKRVLNRLELFGLTQATVPEVRNIIREVFTRIKEMEKVSP